ncbi:hypothetical protein TRAPUB_11987 [Trametes pubescens]|uniref:Uncharacterized protein n=1 Tax=Trametes pubescens TaxID=154538 RepID=A0A1M2VVD9_TRAPU|nr:hypothetical protein TRAPUB_11987 [Trametes pubescens]
MSNLPLPTTNLTEMVIDAVGQPVPASQAAFAQPDPAGSSQPPQPQYVPYQVPPSYPVAGPSHAPLHPMVQGRFPHTYTSPYGAPLPYAVVTHQLMYVRHYQAAMNNTSFRDAMTSIQTRLQTQFWAYFEEHACSREGESRNEHVRQVEDLE